MRIGVDVMGGDHGPQVLVEGATLGLQANSAITELCLVGDQVQIEAGLARAQYGDSRIRVIHASEVLTMDDDPRSAVRKKKDCSMARAIDLVQEGRTEAVISPGNTGGLGAASSYKLGRPHPLERPRIVPPIPTPQSDV